MDDFQSHHRIAGRSGFSPLRGLAWLAGGLAAAAAVVGAVLAIIFTAAVAIMALLTAAVVGLAALAHRGRRAVRPRPSEGGDIIEARNVGGHSWVAYGWDQRSR